MVLRSSNSLTGFAQTHFERPTQEGLCPKQMPERLFVLNSSKRCHLLYLLRSSVAQDSTVPTSPLVTFRAWHLMKLSLRIRQIRFESLRISLMTGFKGKTLHVDCLRNTETPFDHSAEELKLFRFRSSDTESHFSARNRSLHRM
jgi:hypothetical protein